MAHYLSHITRFDAFRTHGGDQRFAFYALLKVAERQNHAPPAIITPATANTAFAGDPDRRQYLEDAVLE